MSTRRLVALLGGALALSLAVNLFLVGAFAGRLSFHESNTLPLAGAGRAGMFARYQALPENERAQFRAAMLPNAAALRAARQELRAARARTLQALQATPYDRARMQQAFAELRAATEARQVALHGALVDAIGTLSAEARGSLAAAAGATQP